MSKTSISPKTSALSKTRASAQKTAKVDSAAAEYWQSLFEPTGEYGNLLTREITKRVSAGLNKSASTEPGLRVAKLQNLAAVDTDNGACVEGLAYLSNKKIVAFVIDVDSAGNIIGFNSK